MSIEEKNYDFDVVSDIDSQIYQLAMYDVTKGKLFFIQDAEKLVELQKRVILKFNYLKAIIQRGDATLKKLRNDILKNYGPYKKDKEENFLDGLDSLDLSSDSSDSVPKVSQGTKDKVPNVSGDIDINKVCTESYKEIENLKSFTEYLKGSIEATEEESIFLKPPKNSAKKKRAK